MGKVLSYRYLTCQVALLFVFLVFFLIYLLSVDWDFTFIWKSTPKVELFNDNDIEIRIKGGVDSANRVQDATLFTLCQNTDLGGMLHSIKSVEERFNNRYHYPWVFANDVPFSDDFKDRISEAVSGNAIFTTIPKQYWEVPANIDMKYVEMQLKKMKAEGVLYGGNLSYRQMCRFNSGFFYKLEALKEYEWYWRVEPNIKFKCDIPYDPFQVMKKEEKVYGFALAMIEDPRTIRRLWKTTRDYFETQEDWASKIPESSHYNKFDDDSRSLEFIEQNVDAKEMVRGDFNLCHYWTNFEIANLDFFRSPNYENYFQILDNTGNFFYERWGDAPVHTLAVSYLLPVSKIKYFDNTGYFHETIGNCPREKSLHRELNCMCSRYTEFSWNVYSAVPRWFEAFGLPLPREKHY